MYFDSCGFLRVLLKTINGVGASLVMGGVILTIELFEKPGKSTTKRWTACLLAIRIVCASRPPRNRERERLTQFRFGKVR